jgi:Glycosyltransferase Family 4
MQIHTASLTSELDARGIDQIVVTAFRPANPHTETVGTSARVVRVGLPIGRMRQLYGLAAIPEIIRAGRVDLVHAHIGEDGGGAACSMGRGAISRCSCRDRSLQLSITLRIRVHLSSSEAGNSSMPAGMQSASSRVWITSCRSSTRST